MIGAGEAAARGVVDEPQFMFGYGSLAAEHARCPIARLRGFRRTWGVAMDNLIDIPGYKSYRLRSDGSRPAVFVAFVDIEDDAAGVMTGVCVPADPTDLAALDDRERNYDRIDVTSHVDGRPPGRVWAYRGSRAGRARLRDGLARGTAVVSRDYLDAVVAAIAAIAPDELARVDGAAQQAGLGLLDLERIDGPAAQKRRSQVARPRRLPPP